MLKNDRVMCVFAAPPPWNQFCTWRNDWIIMYLLLFRVNNCVKNIKVAEESLECTGKIGFKKCWKIDKVMYVFAPPPLGISFVHENNKKNNKKCSKMTELWAFSWKYLGKSTFSEKYFGHFVIFSSFVGRFKDFKSWNRILQDLLLSLMGLKVFLGRRKT